MKPTEPSSTEQQGFLRNHFLIAMPGLSDSLFSHSITFICDHTEDGAMGLVINQPSQMMLDEVYDQMGLPTPDTDFQEPALSGGPVQTDRGFVLHSPEQRWASTVDLTDDVLLTGSQDIIAAMAHGEGPQKRLFLLGYAGWDAGQLEEEIANNAWLTVPADSRIVFDTPLEQRWTAAAHSLGIDLNLISATAGHA